MKPFTMSDLEKMATVTANDLINLIRHYIDESSSVGGVPINLLRSGRVKFTPRQRVRFRNVIIKGLVLNAEHGFNHEVQIFSELLERLKRMEK